MNTDAHFVYSFYAASGECLYVGCTDNVARRIRQHQNERPWASDITRMVVTVHADHSEGLAAEAAKIRAEQPVYNVVHTQKRPIKLLPCARCRTGNHKSCLGINRDGDKCPCSVCVPVRYAA